jgi:hypothetical protein
MNKQLMLGLGGITVVGIVLGVIFLNPFAASTDQSAEPTPIPAKTAQQENQSFSMSFIELMKLGQNYRCQFTSTQDEVTTDGTVYIAEGGNRFRGDFDSTQDTKTTQGHLIRDNEYAYMWSSEQEQGIKMEITPEDESFFLDSNQSEENQDTLDFDVNQEIDFDCDPWSVDATMFVAPQDVTFVDYTEQMKQFQNAAGTPTEGQNACAACNQIPDPTAQAQCKSALGC